MRAARYLFSFLPSLGLLCFQAGCGAKSDGSASATNTANKALDNTSSLSGDGGDWTARQNLEDRFADFSNDVVFDEKGGISKESKRSSFEGTQLTSIGGDIGNQRFEAERYSKKNWKGNKQFDRKSFLSRKNQWNDEEWFLRKQAQEAGTRASPAGKSFATEGFRTNAAREQGGERIVRQGNVQSEARRGLFQAPRVIEKADYEKMSLSESKRLLGRD